MSYLLVIENDSEPLLLHCIEFIKPRTLDFLLIINTKQTLYERYASNIQTEFRRFNAAVDKKIIKK